LNEAVFFGGAREFGSERNERARDELEKGIAGGGGGFSGGRSHGR